MERTARWGTAYHTAASKSMTIFWVLCVLVDNVCRIFIDLLKHVSIIPFSFTRRFAKNKGIYMLSSPCLTNAWILNSCLNGSLTSLNVAYIYQTLAFANCVFSATGMITVGDDTQLDNPSVHQKSIHPRFQIPNGHSLKIHRKVAQQHANTKFNHIYCLLAPESRETGVIDD